MMKKISRALARFALFMFEPVYRLLTQYMAQRGLLLGVYNFPDGGKFLFSSTFASAKTISAITNANPPSCASTGHGYVDNDEILFGSGWEDLDQSIFRVDQTDTDDFTLLGVDTTNTNLFTPGGGAGSTGRKVSAWIEVPQVLTIDTSGGDPRNASFNPVFRRNGISRPLGFNPTIITLSLGHDASNANYKTMLGLSRTLTPVAFKLVLADASASYGYGYMAVSETPKLSGGNPNAVSAVFTAQGRTVSY